MKYIATFEIEFDEQKVRKTFLTDPTSDVDCEQWRILQGENLDHEAYPGYTKGYLRSLINDQIMGSRNHGSDLGSVVLSFRKL